jgi:acetoin utilization deacetylase AcuC-like enzyme/GNAT superfamily N-acetyltransferase
MNTRIYRLHSSAFQEEVLQQVQEIFRENFAAVADYADKIPKLLDAPFTFGYRTILLVAERRPRRVSGFAIVIYFPEVKACYLDFMAVSKSVQGGGLGSSLYEAARELCVFLKARGLYFEVLPDDPALVTDPVELSNNRKRLRFYERYGARPIIGTKFEMPVDESAAPHLVFDGLGRSEPLRRKEAQAAVQVMLERKYSHMVDREYIHLVVSSFRDDPVRIRPPIYVKKNSIPKPPAAGRLAKSFALVVSDAEDLHYVKDSGYVERPARARVLREAALATGLFSVVKPKHAGESFLRAVHDADFLAYLETACKKLGTERPVYPYVFPIRRPERRPKELAVRAGYYCIDTFTPLYPHAYEGARRAASVAVAAAEEILRGVPVAYALCRPPGHHAERRVYGGFCYFNNAAVAAHRLSRKGKVAVLDIDYHHGNGTQNIFYGRADVLTVSLHGHPNFAYPYFSGFADERGEGDGEGFNLNLPLPEQTDEERYLEALTTALRRIERFDPIAIVLSAGFDILSGDPTGGFPMKPPFMEKIGRLVASLGPPLLVVQEGGYSLRNLRRGLPALFGGVAQSLL